MTNLSPAAQAVWNAYLDNTEWEVTQCELKAVAATLRALADQVVPLPRLPYDSCCDVHAASIRAEILAIAAELEGAHG